MKYVVWYPDVETFLGFEADYWTGEGCEIEVKTLKEAAVYDDFWEAFHDRDVKYVDGVVMPYEVAMNLGELK